MVFRYLFSLITLLLILDQTFQLNFGAIMILGKISLPVFLGYIGTLLVGLFGASKLPVNDVEDLNKDIELKKRKVKEINL